MAVRAIGQRSGAAPPTYQAGRRSRRAHGLGMVVVTYEAEEMSDSNSVGIGQAKAALPDEGPNFADRCREQAYRIIVTQRALLGRSWPHCWCNTRSDEHAFAALAARQATRLRPRGRAPQAAWVPCGIPIDVSPTPAQPAGFCIPANYHC